MCVSTILFIWQGASFYKPRLHYSMPVWVSRILGPMDFLPGSIRAERRCIASVLVSAPWLLLALLLGPFAQAATVYRSVDANGVVSYSDSPPADDAEVEILVIDVQDPELSETDQQRLEAMRETTDRMAADRMAREKHRAELREQRARQQAAQEPPVYVVDSDDYPLYYPYRVRRPGWHRPRPDHPIARPPLRPGSPGGPTTLPYRRDYPASLVRKGYSPEVRAAFEK